MTVPLLSLRIFFKKPLVALRDFEMLKTHSVVIVSVGWAVLFKQDSK